MKGGRGFTRPGFFTEIDFNYKTVKTLNFRTRNSSRIPPDTDSDIDLSVWIFRTWNSSRILVGPVSLFCVVYVTW